MMMRASMAKFSGAEAADAQNVAAGDLKSLSMQMVPFSLNKPFRPTMLHQKDHKTVVFFYTKMREF